jgi:hypothetical protein
VVAATATDARVGVWRVAVAAVAVITSATGGHAAAGHVASSAFSHLAAEESDQAGAYLRIAVAANKRLDADFDRVQGPDRADLASSAADLRDIAATELQFDQQLAALVLPPGPESWSHALITANEARAALTTQAAAGKSLARLASYQRPLAAENVPVEQAAIGIRADLGLPAPDTD